MKKSDGKNWKCENLNEPIYIWRSYQQQQWIKKTEIAAKLLKKFVGKSKFKDYH